MFTHLILFNFLPSVVYFSLISLSASISLLLWLWREFWVERVANMSRFHVFLVVKQDTLIFLSSFLFLTNILTKISWSLSIDQMLLSCWRRPTLVEVFLWTFLCCDYKVENSSNFKLTCILVGTVAAAIADIDFFKRREGVEEFFEDGTISFLSIAAIQNGFKIINMLTTSSISR